MDPEAWEDPQEAKEVRAVVAKEPAGGEVLAAVDVEMEADRADDSEVRGAAAVPGPR